ncbi:YceI family protein [Rhodococcus sp. NPDC127530]|uniref:YceI family protein n=1 Tax=unclassified Rhodococcus (in: high G+C Gram-positive bacteria) TaxID=192944 RepID=UPI003634B020
MRKRVWWIVAGVIVVIALVIGVGPWAYAKFLHGDQPDALHLPGNPAPAAADGVLDGAWTVSPGSRAGYEVWETLSGQRTFVRGQTDRVTGAATVQDSMLTTGNIEVDVASIATDDGRRDTMFDTLVMNTASHPTATFAISQPVDLTALPGDGTTITVPVDGKLTLRGQARDVTTNFQVRRSGETIETAGAIDTVWTDYHINKPTLFPNIVVEDAGQVQFSIVLSMG